MSRQIQIRRGTAAEHAGFTGAIGEITMDTDAKTLCVHDGETAGGFALARADAEQTETPAAAIAPDYSNMTTLASRVGFTAPCNGFLSVSNLQNSQSSTNIAHITINGILFVFGAGYSGTDYNHGSGGLPVGAGQTVLFEEKGNANNSVVRFIPYK